MMQTTLENQTEQNTLSIGLIQQDVIYMKKGIDDIKADIKDLAVAIENGYVRKSELDVLKNQFKELQDIWKLVRNTGIIAIIGGLLALLGLTRL